MLATTFSSIKNALITPGQRPYLMRFGPYRGLNLDMDLQYEFQTYLGFYERETHAFLVAHSDYEWFIDVGAGAGEMALLMLRNNPQMRRIVSFEPTASEAAKIRRNCALNPQLATDRIEIRESRVGENTTSDEIPIDQVLPAGMAGPGFIKVDVDGFELEVLRGAARTFREKCVDLLLETHSPALEQHSIEILQGFGLTTQIIKNSWYRSILREQRPSAHNRWLWASNRHLHNNAASK